jgi:hypothetical protein
MRYFTETLPEASDPHDSSQVSALSSRLRDFHWVRLDANTIMGHAEFDETTFNDIAIQGHDTILVYPSLHDSTPVHTHAGKKNKGKHMQAIEKACGAKQGDTIADVVAKMVEKGHTFLSPDK